MIYNVYRGKDCIKKFCESSREHAMKITHFFKKKDEVINSRNHMKIQKSVIFVKKNFDKNMLKIKTMEVNIEVIHMEYVI